MSSVEALKKEDDIIFRPLDTNKQAELKGGKIVAVAKNVFAAMTKPFVNFNNWIDEKFFYDDEKEPEKETEKVKLSPEEEHKRLLEWQKYFQEKLSKLTENDKEQIDRLNENLTKIEKRLAYLAGILNQNNKSPKAMFNELESLKKERFNLVFSQKNNENAARIIELDEQIEKLSQQFEQKRDEHIAKQKENIVKQEKVVKPKPKEFFEVNQLEAERQKVLLELEKSDFELVKMDAMFPGASRKQLEDYLARIDGKLDRAKQMSKIREEKEADKTKAYSVNEEGVIDFQKLSQLRSFQLERQAVLEELKKYENVYMCPEKEELQTYLATLDNKIKTLKSENQPQQTVEPKVAKEEVVAEKVVPSEIREEKIQEKIAKLEKMGVDSDFPEIEVLREQLKDVTGPVPDDKKTRVKKEVSQLHPQTLSEDRLDVVIRSLENLAGALDEVINELQMLKYENSGPVYSKKML